MDTYVPLQQKAYDDIREMIHNGTLEKDKFYSEKKIASAMNMSRTPVRDAILRLSQDRYIDIVPSKGFRLHEMTEKDIWDAYEVRTAIEGFCALHLRAERNTEAGKKCIGGLCDDLTQMKEDVDRGSSTDELLQHDFAFHRRIVDFSRNQDLIRLFESYYHMLLNIADISIRDPGRPLKACREHKAIFDGIRSDTEDAGAGLYQSVINHMKAARDIALKRMNAGDERTAD